MGVTFPFADNDFQREMYLLSYFLSNQFPILNKFKTNLQAFHVCNRGKVDKISKNCFTLFDKNDLCDFPIQLANNEIILSGWFAQQINVPKMFSYIVDELKNGDNFFFIDNNEVEEVSFSNSKIMFSCKNGDKYFAVNGFLCIGSWIKNKLLDHLVFKDSIRAKKIIYFTINRFHNNKEQKLFFFHNRDAFLICKDKEYCLSIKSNEWDVLPEDNVSPSKEELDMVNSLLLDYFPTKQAKVSSYQGFSGLYTHNKDPVILESQGIPGLFFVGAASGRGAHLAAGLAWKALMEINSNE